MIFSADGSSICSLDDLPIPPSRAQLVYDAKLSGAGKAWIWDVAIDKVTNTTCTTACTTTTRYVYYYY